MREYSRFSPQFWIGDTGKKIRKAGPDCQIVGAYLITAPSSNVIGLYYLPLIIAAHETGIPFERCSNAVRTLSELGFCRYDDESEVVWVVEAARWQLGDSGLTTNHAKGAATAYEAVPNNAFLADFYDKYSAQIPMSERRSNGVGTPSESVRTASGSVRITETETETETLTETSDDDGDEKINAPLAKARSVDPRSDQVREVFDHYRSYHPQAHKTPNSKLKEWAAIKARFDEGYTVEDLKQAIDGMQRTPWNQGENPSNTKYDKLHLVVRDGGQVSRFIEQAHHTANGTPLFKSEREMRSSRATQAWLEAKRRERGEAEQLPLTAEVV